MVLQQKIEQCQLHLERMKQAAEHIKHLYPFQEKDFPLQRYEDLTSLDMFTGRFAKLQNTMSEGLFPEFLDFLGEDVAVLSMIDRLNKLEKYHVLESASQWRFLRDLRNKLSHEYPDAYSALVDTLNKVFENCYILEKILETIIQKHKYYIQA